MDPRNEILAQNLVNYSTAVKAGDKVLHPHHRHQRI